MVSKILVFAFIVGTASAATWIGKPPTKPAQFADKDGCYIKEINDVIPFGETITPIGVCYRIHCAPMMDYASCGLVASSDPKCHKVETDLSKPYPECCPTYKCEVDNDIEI